MAIMYILLCLSGVLIIFAAVYTNYKKKNNKIYEKQVTPSKEEKEKLSRKTKKQLSDILQIKVVNDILCIGNRYSQIIRLGSVDYNMLSNSEQDMIENILVQTALSFDYPIQFFSTTEYIDTTKTISLMKENKSSNAKIQEYKQLLIDYLDNLMQNRAISIVKNYAIISYDGLYKDAVEELNRKSMSFISNLLSAQIVCQKLQEDEIYSLIYRELNKNSALSALNITTLVEGGRKLYVNNK